MRLVGAVTQGSGTVNDDGWGYVESKGDVSAAWIFDGVTGVNSCNYLGAGTDAAWLVGLAQGHLTQLAAMDISLQEILRRLVQRLIADWHDASNEYDVPENYDPPATCLILAKRYGRDWRAVCLGDSCLLARDAKGACTSLISSPNVAFDHWLTAEATKRRNAGVLNINGLITEFRPQFIEYRKLRNTLGGYSILEANPLSAEFAQYLDIGPVEELLLCTDGYYRAVGCYGLFTDEGLFSASLKTGGVDLVLQDIRAVEKTDPGCKRYPRFKPADDATAVMLSR